MVVGVGSSGNRVATMFLEELLELSGDLGDRDIFQVSVDRVADAPIPTIRVIPPGAVGPVTETYTLPTLPNGGDVLLVDDVERTGETMRLAHEAIAKMYQHDGGKNNAVRVWSYSIAISATSSFVPSWYGFVYAPHVYVYRADGNQTVPNFVLDHQLKRGTNSNTHPPRPFLLRKPKHSDPNFEIPKPRSMERYQAADRYFDNETKSKTVLVIEHNDAPVGYLSYHVDGKNFWISSIAICGTVSEQLRGAGHAMFSYAENAAIALGCKKILLWAYTEKKETYLGWGCYPVGETTVSIPATSSEAEETYHLMAYRVEPAKRFLNY